MRNHLLTLIFGIVIGIAAFKPLQSYMQSPAQNYDTTGLNNLMASVQPIEFIDGGK